MNRLTLIAGPCVVESEEITMQVAAKLAQLSNTYDIGIIFKSSYRKANRTHKDSFEGIGMKPALKILEKVKDSFGCLITTDVHTEEEAYYAADTVNILQIPAFLCRQTDLLIAAATTGRGVNIKKGQFASANTMFAAVEKVQFAGGTDVWVTERGNFFGYEDLVVDMRNVPRMKLIGVPVFVDITHSNGGTWHMSKVLGNCAIAAGADGLFLETHPNPDLAKSDTRNMIPLDYVERMIVDWVKIWEATR